MGGATLCNCCAVFDCVNGNCLMKLWLFGCCSVQVYARQILDLEMVLEILGVSPTTRQDKIIDTTQSNHEAENIPVRYSKN